MIGRPLYRFGSVDSTQSVARAFAEAGAPHGTVVTAEHQSDGRGRLNRRWDAPPGASLLCSVILRPEVPAAEWGSLSLLVADAVRAVVSDAIGVSAEIKWPNDVLVQGRKVSGILLQSIVGQDPFVIAGIGINVNTYGADLPMIATSMRQVAGGPLERNGILRALFGEMEVRLASFAGSLPTDHLAQLNSHLALRGHVVTLLDADREITGTIRRLDRTGALLLQTETGLRRFVAGEIERGPRPA